MGIPANLQLDVLRDALLSQQNEIGQSQSCLNQTKTSLNVVASNVYQNAKNFRRIGLSNLPSDQFSKENIAYKIMFSFLSFKDLIQAKCVCVSWKSFISEGNYLERAFILQLGYTHPEEAVELSKASPAVQRIALLIEKSKKSAQTLDTIKASCEKLNEILVKTPAALALAAILTV